MEPVVCLRQQGALSSSGRSARLPPSGIAANRLREIHELSLAFNTVNYRCESPFRKQSHYRHKTYKAEKAENDRTAQRFEHTQNRSCTVVYYYKRSVF